MSVYGSKISKAIEKRGCTGCSACCTICATGALKMRADEEGFLYPILADKGRCLNCGCCLDVCPIEKKEFVPREPLAVYAAKSNDDTSRLASSSGGIFSLLCKEILSGKGIVFGAGWDAHEWKVVHCAAENLEQLRNIQCSKYVQSDIVDAYLRVERAIGEDRPVLFSGTPCQIAGLRSYLQSKGCRLDNDKLFCVEIACAAVPSPGVWRRYLEETGKSSQRNGIVKEISFRCKEVGGWRDYALRLSFADGTDFIQDFHNNAYLRGFNHQLFNRRSCHDCRFRNLRSGADMTIGDYWNVGHIFPDMDDNKGTSLVLVNTLKGMRMYKKIRAGVTDMVSNFSEACKVNHVLIGSPAPNKLRHLFFGRIALGHRVDETVNKLLARPWWLEVSRFLKRIIKKVLYK